MTTNDRPPTCADCGAPFGPTACGSIASGCAITSVPRLPDAGRMRCIGADGKNYGLANAPTADVACTYFPARYDVEGDDARAAVVAKLGDKASVPDRAICYACCAVLESETMTAHGRGCVYLTQKEWKPGDPWAGHVFTRRTMSGERRYTYHVSNWPGTATFRLLGAVRESKGYGFGGSYPVATFSIAGPDGYVWSGRCAGDMQLARVKRTKRKVTT